MVCMFVLSYGTWTWTCPINVDSDLDLTVAGLVTSLERSSSKQKFRVRLCGQGETWLDCGSDTEYFVTFRIIMHLCHGKTGFSIGFQRNFSIVEVAQESKQMTDTCMDDVLHRDDIKNITLRTS